MTILECADVTKHFGGLAAIVNLHFKIEEGGIIGLIGPNGAGKTTLLNLISGSLPPSSGEIRFKGERISGMKPHKICKRGIARTFQTVKLFGNITVYENIFLGSVYGRHRSVSQKQMREWLDHLLEFSGLAPKQEILAKDLTIVDQKLVELTRALATAPDLLLLDEFIAGLNPVEIKTACDMIKQINAEGTTIIMIEHVMDVIMSMSDRIVVLNYGQKIAEGGPAEISKDPKVIEIYLGEDFECSG